MKKYFLNLLFLLLGICQAANFYLLADCIQETQYKKRILELEEKKLSTSSMALETLYQDSINNTVNLWLYGASE